MLMSKKISTRLRRYAQTKGTADPKRHFSPEALKFIKALSLEKRNCVLKYLWCNSIPHDTNNPDDMEILFFVADVRRSFYNKYVSRYDLDSDLERILDTLIEIQKPWYYDYIRKYRHSPLRVKITPEITEYMLLLDTDHFAELIKWIDLTPANDESPNELLDQYVLIGCDHISEKYFSPGALYFIEALNSEQRNCLLKRLWCNNIPYDARGTRNARETDAMKILIYISGISKATYDAYRNYKFDDLTHNEEAITDELDRKKYLGLHSVDKIYRSVPFRPKITSGMIKYMLSLDAERFDDAIKWIDLTI